MVLEAAMICLDTSERTRNGDVFPTRFKAQNDAVNLLAGAKTQDNPESSVGLITMAGKTPKVLTTPKSDLGSVLSQLHILEPGGKLNVKTSVQVAQLALKHRKNRSQRQRIVLFVGSPVAENADDLEKVGKLLKKSNVSIDVVNYGDCEHNADKLRALVAAADNSTNTCHLVTVEQSEQALSDALIGTEVFGEGGGSGGSAFAAAAAAAGAAAAGQGEGSEMAAEGVDPNVDPELAMALRMSLEEEQQRQQQQADASSEREKVSSAQSSGKREEGGMDLDEDDEEMRQAIAMSLNESSNEEPNAPAGQVHSNDPHLQAALQSVRDSEQRERRRSEEKDQANDEDSNQNQQ